MAGESPAEYRHSRRAGIRRTHIVDGNVVHGVAGGAADGGEVSLFIVGLIPVAGLQRVLVMSEASPSLVPLFDTTVCLVLDEFGKLGPPTRKRTRKKQTSKPWSKECCSANIDNRSASWPQHLRVWSRDRQSCGSHRMGFAGDGKSGQTPR
jgi:hypothetical protein